MSSSTLGSLPTEAINPRTANLSRVSTLEALQLINDEEATVADAVREVLPHIADAVEAIAERLQRGGRMFYVGAGTPGRLGIVDATECPPTFGTPPEMVQPIMAGGNEAVFASMEAAEDVEEAGAADLRERGLTANDAVVGLSASGRTPFVIGGLRYAREIGALAVGVSTHDGAALRADSDFFIAPHTGPEAVTGSTRLKAGTSQKMVLNLISTGVMLRLGYVEGNMMVRVQPWCEKLVDRSQRIIMRMTGVNEQAAQAALEKSGGNVEQALASLRMGEKTPA